MMNRRVQSGRSIGRVLRSQRLHSFQLSTATCEASSSLSTAEKLKRPAFQMPRMAGTDGLPGRTTTPTVDSDDRASDQLGRRRVLNVGGVSTVYQQSATSSHRRSRSSKTSQHQAESTIGSLAVRYHSSTATCSCVDSPLNSFALMMRSICGSFSSAKSTMSATARHRNRHSLLGVRMADVRVTNPSQLRLPVDESAQTDGDLSEHTDGESGGNIQEHKPDETSTKRQCSRADSYALMSLSVIAASGATIYFVGTEFVLS